MLRPRTGPPKERVFFGGGKVGWWYIYTPYIDDDFQKLQGPIQGPFKQCCLILELSFSKAQPNH